MLYLMVGCLSRLTRKSESKKNGTFSKVSLFVGHGFSRKRDNNPWCKYHMKKGVLRIYRMMLRMLGLGWWITNFGATLIDRYFGTWCRLLRSIQYSYTLILVSFDRYAFHLVPCGFWRWVIHFSFKKQSNSSQNARLRPKVFQKSQLFSKPARPTSVHILSLFFKFYVWVGPTVRSSKMNGERSQKSKVIEMGVLK
jgi:hypothetical protein